MFSPLLLYLVFAHRPIGLCEENPEHDWPVHVQHEKSADSIAINSANDWVVNDSRIGRDRDRWHCAESILSQNMLLMVTT